MNTCPHCTHLIDEHSLICPACHAELTNSITPTRLFISAENTPTSPLPAKTSSSPSPGFSGRFISGTMLAERYRIVGLLGKGGMGEVYKAEDLTLGQTVALKFLPDALALDGSMLARFHNEVRIARQVSHSNVCRVYDIGEINGLHFLSMEFIDGEDLSSLLRRIGRLPHDKALEISRQLCAGLSAAHENNVLHRDLKPANVMIDGRGKARITDFGLAVIAEELRDHDIASGTPAYMAPEQIKGQEVTAQSDLYSLGLVIYELFTGKRAFEAKTIHELVELHEKSVPTTPSSFVKDIDPLVERVILRCLEKKPAERPASAIQIAAALPGGDPLQAALAAGETPSPEMVAAAGEKVIMKPWHAILCLTVILICLLISTIIGKHTLLIARTYFENSPEVLSRKGREIISQLGYPERPVDTAQGYQTSGYYTRVIFQQPSPDAWKKLEKGKPYPLIYWYRESPRILLGAEGMESSENGNPAKTTSNMANVRLDMYGDLLYFEALPPQLDVAVKNPLESPPNTYIATTPDWNQLFQLAKLDITKFTPTIPNWTPLAIVDARAAWTGKHPDAPEIDLRIEAASYRGKFVYFDVLGPWRQPWRTTVFNSSQGEKISLATQYGLITICVIAAFYLVRRNLRRGLGDRRGAGRLAIIVFFASFLMRYFRRHHTFSEEEIEIITNAVRWAILDAAGVWSLYIAVEPFVRKIWAHCLISWNRVLSGNFFDSVVGRDLLLGICGGAIILLISSLTDLYLFKQHSMPQQIDYDSLLGFRYVLSITIASIRNTGLSVLFSFMLIFLIRMMVKNNWLTAILFILLSDAGQAFSAVYPGANLTYNISADLLALFLLFRYGFLSFAVAGLFGRFFSAFPLTTDFSTWYSWISIYGFAIVTLVSGFAFRQAISGQKIFQSKLLED